MSRSTVNQLCRQLAHTLSLIAAAEIAGNEELAVDLQVVYEYLEERLAEALVEKGFAKIVFVKLPLDVSDLTTGQEIPF